MIGMDWSGSHRAATDENQLDPDGGLWLVVRCTAKAATACVYSLAE